MADNIRFQQGLLKHLKDQQISNGTLWFTTDEGAIYLDTNGKRVRFGDYVIVDTVADLPASGHAYETALYYVKNDNILARWDATNSKWVQLNAAGLKEVTPGGENADTANANEVNVLSYLDVALNDKGAKVLTYKTTKVASAARVDNAEAAIEGLQASVNTLNGNAEVAGSVDNKIAALRDEILGGDGEDGDSLASLAIKVANAQKAADDAQSTADKNADDIEDLGARLEAAEGNIGTINTNLGTGKVDDRIEAAKNAVLGTSADAAGAATVAGANKAAAAAQAAAEAAQETANDNADALENLEPRVEAAEGAIAVLKGDKNTQGSVAYQIAEIVANAPSDFDTLKEIADWIANDTTGSTAMANDISGLKQSVEDLQDADEDHEARLEALEAADATIRGEIASGDAQVKADIVGSANEGYRTLAEIETKVIANATAAQNAQDAADAAQTLAEENEGRIEDLEAAVEGHAASIGQNTTNITNLTTTVNNLDSAYKAADEQVKRDLIGTATTYNTLGAIEAKLIEHGTAIENLEARTDAIETRLTWGTFTAAE